MTKGTGDTVEVGSWIELMETVDLLISEPRIYRGMTDTKYKLLPGIGRHSERENNINTNIWVQAYYPRYEVDMLENFKR